MATLIFIADKISRNLSFRHSADTLFRDIDASNDSIFVIDFTDVESVTGAFAHQYLQNKKTSIKITKERNVPNDIQPMFDLVKRRSIV